MKSVLFSIACKLVAFLLVIFLNGCERNEQEQTFAYFDLKVVLAKSELLHQEKIILNELQRYLKVHMTKKKKIKPMNKLNTTTLAKLISESCMIIFNHVANQQDIKQLKK
ncbi:hypothetical protein RVX52_001197 [Enterobacter cloacae]|nr:hypothetical protein [Enterobacter cloacae]